MYIPKRTICFFIYDLFRNEKLIKWFVEKIKKILCNFQRGLDGNALPVERLSYQSEVEAPKRFSVQQWIEENEVYAERINIYISMASRSYGTKT